LQRYVVRRVGALAVTLFFVSLLVFVVVRVLPGDPALIILGLEANADSVARVRQALGLDQPVPVQYVQWVGHALRNALIPIVTVAGVQLGQLLAGSIILESVFYLPGLGRLTLAAISARDLPVVQGVVLFVASMIVTVNAAVDILYGILDPRIRYG
jgi:peptide/nickel transport system permease protein